MIIDQKGKLFGLINIIDLCIVVVLAAAIIFIIQKLLTPALNVTNQEYIMKFYAEETPSYVGEAIKIGDKVEDEQKNIDLGAITDIIIDEGYMYVPDAQGNLHKAAKEGYSAIEITSELWAQPFENGVIINGNKYGIGHSFTIRAGSGKLYLKISGIEPKA